MNNPLHILQTLDHHLSVPAQLTLFGRAALALGYPNSPPTFAATSDVDAILPQAWLDAEDQNADFWGAQQRANAELESEGLYLTRLFRESEVILTPAKIRKRRSNAALSPSAKTRRLIARTLIPQPSCGHLLPSGGEGRDEGAAPLH